MIPKVFNWAAGMGLALSCSAGAAFATVPVYATPGVMNTTTYNFTATNTGDVTAYFAGSTARYDETLTMLVNGVATGVVGLNNHSSSLGQALDFGHVEAGATLTFEISVANSGATWYSNAAMNADGDNHIFSTAYAGGDGIPAGTYVGFEDLAGGHSDWNYHDETFVFTDVSTVATTPGGPSTGPSGGSTPSGAPPLAKQTPPPTPDTPIAAGVPEPATWAMMLMGFGGLGAAMRARRGRFVAAA